MRASSTVPRHRWVAWLIGLHVAAASALVVAPAAAAQDGQPAAASATPTIAAAQSPEAIPSLVPLEGVQPFLDTDWLLIGYLAAAGGPYVSADDSIPAWLRFGRASADERLFDATTGCLDLRGDWSRGPRQAESPTRTLQLSVWGRDELPPCDPAIQPQDEAVRERLGDVGAYTLAVQGPDALGYDLDEGDFDADLWQHFADYPDLVRLVLRDRSGEAVLLYVPVAPPVSSDCAIDCAPNETPSGSAEAE